MPALREAVEQWQMKMIMAMCVPWDVCHNQDLEEQEELQDPIAFAASTNPDIMHCNDAKRAPNSKEFFKAMKKEIDSHSDNEHWENTPRAQAPKGQPTLPAIWAFRRKRRISTNEIHKWKARINVHGRRQECGINCWETHSPVVGWPMIWLFLNLMTMNGWTSRQVDFVLAFPQAEIECDMHMEVPLGFEVNGNRRDHRSFLRCNLCGQKQAGHVWNKVLHDGPLARGFTQSAVDMCVNCRGSVALLICTDDGTCIDPDQSKIQECHALLTKAKKDATGKLHRAFKMTDEGSLSDYLGVKITPLDNGTFKPSQPHLINSVLDDLGLGDNKKENVKPTSMRPTPASSHMPLDRDIDGEGHDKEWHCKSVTGRMKFLEKSTRADITHSAHQCAGFSSDLKKSHAQAVKCISRCLLSTCDKGFTLNPHDVSFDV